MLSIAPRLRALDPERALSQYLRDQWGSERGFPGGPVYALAQTGDGYLWIGTEKGLVRFDGLSFRFYQPSGLSNRTGPTVLGLVSAPDGSLWARLRGPALMRFRHGAFEDILTAVGLPESVVTAMYRGPGDVLLLATLAQGGAVYRGGRFSPIAPASSVPTSSFVISLAQSANGDSWLGTRDAGLLHVQGQRVTRIMQGLPDLKINCLLAGDAGEVWIGTDHGLARWNGHEVTRAGLPEGLAGIPALAMIRDRQSNVWIAAGARGLLRVNSRGVAAMPDRDPRTQGDVTTVFEDREGNIWSGTTRGIERLRDGVFTSYATVQGLPSDTVGPLHADAAQRVWFAPSEGGLYFLRNGEVGRVADAGLPTDVVYSIAGTGDDVWVGRQHGGLTHLRPQGAGVTVERFTQADGLAQNSVYAVHQARDGTVWAGTLSGGVSRLRAGAFTTYTTDDGLASNTVASIVESADGTMWFGTPSGVSTLSPDGWRRYAVKDGLAANDVNVLFEDSAQNVWVGTAGGLSVFHGGQLRPLVHLPGALRGSILGIAEDRSGSLWITTSDRLVRVSRAALLDQTGGEAVVRDYSIADGLLSLEGVKRHRSVIADAGGRIWFAMSRGLSMADPRAGGPAAPSLLRVEEVFADGAAVDVASGAHIPPGSRRVTLSYAGLNLSTPERVRFRYRLDGFDAAWSEPVTDRQAGYTNLSPGPYVFRVMASNGDGIWDGAEASVKFDVAPSVWQASWFQLSGLLLCAALGWAGYRLRVAVVARRLHARFEERLAERTRIAQALHDTLLQGFISASMQLHVAADRLPPDSPARPSLGRILDLMARVIDEGRNAVQGLRSSAVATDDLELAFSGIHQELAVSARTAFRVIIEGGVRPLHPTIRDEVYRIGREALVNAFRHAGARSVEVELDYGSRMLRVLVRDDGRGMDPAVAQSGREGHWGLAGMRERAEAIGAGFKVRSRAGAGTEVELTVPADVAFARTPGGGGRWARLFSRTLERRRP